MSAAVSLKFFQIFKRFLENKCVIYITGIQSFFFFFSHVLVFGFSTFSIVFVSLRNSFVALELKHNTKDVNPVWQVSLTRLFYSYFHRGVRPPGRLFKTMATVVSLTVVEDEHKSWNIFCLHRFLFP